MPSDYSGSYTSDEWDAVMSVLDDGVPHLTLGGETKSKWPSGGGSTSAARATRTSTYSVSSGVWASVPLDSAPVLTGDVSHSSGQITVNASGLWAVSADITVQNGGTVEAARIRNVDAGTTVTYGSGIAPPNREETAPNAERTVSLSSGDTLELQVYQSSGFAVDVQPGPSTFLNVQKL